VTWAEDRAPVGTDPSADPGAKTEGWAAAKLVLPIFPLPFGIGTHAINPSRRSREPADRKQRSIRETVSRTGVSQEGWFSISG
jgi:hypothetical protein